MSEPTDLAIQPGNQYRNAYVAAQRTQDRLRSMLQGLESNANALPTQAQMFADKVTAALRELLKEPDEWSSILEAERDQQEVYRQKELMRIRKEQAEAWKGRVASLEEQAEAWKGRVASLEETIIKLQVENDALAADEDREDWEAVTFHRWMSEVLCLVVLYDYDEERWSFAVKSVASEGDLAFGWDKTAKRAMICAEKAFAEVVGVAP
jgi:hypothetical protein